MLFGTTEEFLRSFGVQSIDELPVISEELVEKFKDEAQMELEAEIREQEIGGEDDDQLALDI